ncbi:hypothetical protein FCI58_24175 [Enterobacter hormaechei]|nr:hypothetical protein [Enterobacter hormaechei]
MLGLILPDTAVDPRLHVVVERIRRHAHQRIFADAQNRCFSPQGYRLSSPQAASVITSTGLTPVSAPRDTAR